MIGAPPPPRVPVPSAIVRRAKEGDVRAEDELVDHFHPGLLSHLTRRIHDREDARELANDVLMAVVQAVRADRVRDPARLAGFVYGIARNLVNNYLRARCAQPVPDQLEMEPAAEDVGERLDQLERLARVQAGLDGLRDLERRILLLTLEGLKPGQIADRLGLSGDVVRARKSRAMRKLAATLGLEPGARRPRARRWPSRHARAPAFRPRRPWRIR